MKLFTRYNRATTMLTIVVMLVLGVIYYYVISGILTSQVDRDLEVEEQEIFEHVKLNHELPVVYPSNHQFIYLTPVKSPVKRRFIDTQYKDPDENAMEPARGLISSVVLNSQRYQIRVVQSTVETEDLIRVIFMITAGVIIVLLVVLQVFNRMILTKLWQPFYTVLNQLKVFSPSNQTILDHATSEIDEFNDLNKAVSTMSARAVDDYIQLKTFTENAAHEMMTPVAIINSKLDSLLQTDEFTQNQSVLLKDLYDTVTRLTRLNKSMLLLTKIENRLIADEQVIDLKELIDGLLHQFDELFSGLEISVTADLTEHSIKASRFLVEVLFNNLIGNAIRHNHRKGHVHVTLTQAYASINNTGKPSALDMKLLSKRFQKSAESEGTGLGLALCKQVCENCGFKLQYDFTDEQHTFKVIF
ncbi:HAMP domain-containing sensor histidine kinase [Mucilaginibacter gynuensis]|uniref:histidine kinase n=1 Tax=Mucilaginibacter gynuensis TaxID=1302236 RepID=A0ABP8FPP3_9SPHI